MVWGVPGTLVDCSRVSLEVLRLSTTLLCAARRLRSSSLARYGIWLWAGVIVALVAVFAVRQRSDLVEAGQTLGDARVEWLLGIALCQSLAFALTALSYQRLLRRLGHRLPVARLASLYLQRQMVGTVTPFGGPASLYVFLRGLARDGVSPADGLLLSGLRTATGHLSFVLLLLPVVLLTRPSQMVLAATGALVVVVGLIVWATLLVVRGDGAPAWLAGRLPARLHAYAEQACRHQVAPWHLAGPTLLALLANLASAGMLYASLHAVGENPALHVPLIGFVLGNLFMLIAPVFQGFGVVELTMVLALQQSGIPAAAALGATILFRLGDLWLPLAVGVATQVAGRLDSSPALRRAPSLALGVVGGVFSLSPALLLLPVSLKPLDRVVALPASLPTSPDAAWFGLVCIAVAVGSWRGRPIMRLGAIGVAAALAPGLVVEQLQLLASLLPL